MEIRKEFVFRAMEPGSNMAALCREYGISRKSGYERVRRFKEQGMAGLSDQSRRPHSHALAVSAEVACEIIRLKREHMSWGPKKIQQLLIELKRFDRIPNVRTVARVLERAGLVSKRRVRRPPTQAPTSVPSVEVSGPNDLWTVDFKGWWRTGDGSRCEPLTVRDAFSRLLLCVRILPSSSRDEVQAVFEELFAKYGLPKAMLSDNGSPFGCTSALGGLSALSAWWVSLGIEVHRSRVGCPQDNGGHERMHRDVRIELQQCAAATPEEQQAACDVWRHTFNHVRPHEALGMKTPASVYRRSERRYALRLMPNVPSDCETRLVTRAGRARLYGQQVFLGTAFSGYEVGFRAIAERRYEVWFYQRLLGHYAPDQAPHVEPLAPPHHPPQPNEQRKGASHGGAAAL